MATLYISEHSAGVIAGTQCVAQPPSAEQTVAIGVSSVQSNAFGGDTKIIRVHADSACSIKIGADPTATASTARMAANQTEYFAVQTGHKIAVISNS